MARRRSEERRREWRERLGRYRGCGLSVAAFCEREGVSTAAFYQWRRRLEGKRAPKPRRAGRDQPLFVPVTVRQAETGVRIELPGGAVVHLPPGAEEGLVRACIRAAAERPQDEEASAC